MQKLMILNSKEVRKVQDMIKEGFGCGLDPDYVFLKSSNKEKIYIVNRDIGGIDFSKIRIDTIGMYFARLDPIGLRFSIEGSQLVGPEATKNVLELSKEQQKQWMLGMDLELGKKQLEAVKGEKGFVIIKHKDDFMGCGKIRGKDLLNFVPKARRVNA